MIIIETTIELALTKLTSRQANGYAGSVLRGYQLWSGADLKGKAKRYGAVYAKQRRIAAQALRQASGLVVACEHGKLHTSIPAGMDDYGNALIITRSGVARLHARGNQFHHIP